MKRILQLLLCLVAGIKLQAQHGAAYWALGANESNKYGAMGLANNPGVAFQQRYVTGAWGQQRFTATDIVYGGLVAATKVKNSMFGVDYAMQGTANFSLNNMHVSMCQQVSKAFSAGFSVGYSKTAQALGIENNSSLSGRIGARFDINEKWDAAAVVINPWNKVGDDFRTANAGALSLGYKVNALTETAMQYRYQQGFQPVYGVSLRHMRGKHLVLMGSLQTGPEPVSGGIAFTKGKLELSMATRYHTRLGFSPAFSLVWVGR